MRYPIALLFTLACSSIPADAQVSVNFGVPGVSIGINLPVYPQLVPVPGYPVYYAPQVNSNYFFYEGMYWIYQGDTWYASTWYNGPWSVVAPAVVPVYVLRVPVRYYRQAPAYFHGWRADAPPRWDEHWGNAWAQQRSGWNTWNRNAVPAAAPLPAYQRQYSGNRYPQIQQQQTLQSQNYRYQPHDAVVQQQYQAQRAQTAPPPAQRVQAVPPQPQRAQVAPAPVTQARPGATQERPSPPPDQHSANRPASHPQGAPAAARGPPPQQGVQAPVVAQAPPQQGRSNAPRQSDQPPQGAPPRGQRADEAQDHDNKPQGKPTAKESKEGQSQGHGKGDEQGGDHGK